MDPPLESEHQHQPKNQTETTTPLVQGKTAVLTGAGSGFGLECARIAAQRGVKVVLVDVQRDALAWTPSNTKSPLGASCCRSSSAVASVPTDGGHGRCRVYPLRCPHLVFNNAGWLRRDLENTLKDWEVGARRQRDGVVHGLRNFTPMM
jgi:NAD(P)-dependent dehydrogenase (short-subunit alcohol dehydrogenase family)